MKNPFKKFLDPKTQIAKHGKWYAIAPLAIIAIGLVIVLIWNFNLGLDFTGGRIIKVPVISSGHYAQTKEVVNDVITEELGANVAKRVFYQLEEGSGGAGSAMTARYPEPKGTSQEVDDTNARIAHKIGQKLEELGIWTGEEVKAASNISPSASSERLLNVFIAVFAALILILVYMLFRFKFTSGVAAVVGLFHDVLIMLACMAIFRIQINFVFVAAVITIVAYSLNNTLVLFDRVRDKDKDTTNTLTPIEKVDSSIKETFFRTMMTTITTLVPIIILCIFGVSSIREFTLPILFGLLAGTYSTLFITSTLYVRFENAKIAKAKMKMKKKSA